MIWRAVGGLLLGIACCAPIWAQDYDSKASCDSQSPPRKGKGVYLRSDCARFEGTFDGGQMFGPGRVTYQDGRVVEGNFRAGRLNGKGVATWPDGRRYEGYFLEGRSQGPGVYTTADGTVYEGKFLPGARLQGWGTRRGPDGTTLIGEFRDGEPFGDMLLVKPDGGQEVAAYGWGGKPPAPASAAQKAGAGTTPAAPAGAQKPQEPTSSGATTPVEEISNTIRTLRGILGK